MNVKQKAELFADAIKTIQKRNKLPSELLTENVNLLENLNEALNLLDKITKGSGWYAIPQSHKEQAKELIKKRTIK